MKLITLMLLVSVAILGATLNAWEYTASNRLESSAVVDQHPNKGLYRLNAPSQITATLTGDSDFDLYLYTFKNGVWTEVAHSSSDAWNEILNYQTKEDAWFSWFVVLKSPNTTGGEYTLKILTD